MEVFCIYAVQCNQIATSYICLLSTWNMASVTKELNFKFYFNLNFNSHLWLVATTLDTTALAFTWVYFQLLAIDSLFSDTLILFTPLIFSSKIWTLVTLTTLSLLGKECFSFLLAKTKFSVLPLLSPPAWCLLHSLPKNVL